MKVVLNIAAAAALLIAGQAMAANAPAPKEAAACLACHQVDKKVVGPAYKDVAKKYAGNKDAVNHLTAKVVSGGKGVWGEIPMPPKGGTALSEAQIKSVVTWIMGLK
ncbi:MAG: c-type cytochrome [Sulfuricella sp.]|nr:c-type cytochrome [Sulfuricella sp.]